MNSEKKYKTAEGMEDFNPIDVVIEKAQKIVFDRGEIHIPEEFKEYRSKKEAE